MLHVTAQNSPLEYHNSSPCRSILLKNGFVSHLSQHPRRSCLILLFFLLQLVLLSHSPRLRPLFSGLPEATTQVEVDHQNYDQQCHSGKFFVYDLPKEFNTDIVENCESIKKPVLGSRCPAVSNSGFGPEATKIDLIIPFNLSTIWYLTDLFALEIIFHNRMLHHKCRTLDAESATAYYIPFYAGFIAETYLWADVSNEVKDHLCVKLLSWVQDSFPYYNKSKGLDHFLVMGRLSMDFRRQHDSGSKWKQWGLKCNLMPSMKNITRLIVERDVSDDFEVGVPFPTGFHPNTPNDVVSWQRFVLSRPRRRLMSYSGGPRSWLKIRGTLAEQCQSYGDAVCHMVDCSGTKCSNGTNGILESFLDSDFCLQPRGDGYTRRSTFDCMVAGSIPVFFWRESAYLQYEWFLPDDPKTYSVFIDHEEVLKGKSVKAVLEKFSKEEVKRMREKVVETIPKLVYAKPNEGLGDMKDAVDVALDGVFRRIDTLMKNSHGS